VFRALKDAQSLVGSRARKPLWAVAVMVSLALGLGAFVLPQTSSAAVGRILIYGPSLMGSPDNEKTLAEAAGYEVTVAGPETWLGMTTFEFAQYDAIVFGDPSCNHWMTTAPLATAEMNRFVWSSAVTGPMVVIGNDPVHHQSQFTVQANALTSNAIKFAAGGTSTGLYVSLSCYYDYATNARVNILNDFGEFRVHGRGAGGLPDCPDNVEIVEPTHPVMEGLTVAGLSNWSCSVHDVFAAYPPDFNVVARESAFTDRAYIIATNAAGRGPVTDAPERYAPFVYLHPNETAFPSTASDFIVNSRLRWSHDGCTDHAVDNPDGRAASYDKIVQSRLGAASGVNAYSHEGNNFICRHSGTVYLAHQLTRPYDGGSERATEGAEGMFLDLNNRTRDGNPELAADPVYYEYLKGRYVVYWFFYRHNPNNVAGIGTHEGDWEHITVRLDANDLPLEVAYYRHSCDPDIYSWSELQSGDGVNFGLRYGTHPIVYSAEGSHASYARAGSYGASTCQGPDDAASSARTWTTSTNLLNARTQPWYGYGGAWGEVGESGHNTGALGPSRYKLGGAVPSGW
jgi:hypothetical protein